MKILCTIDDFRDKPAIGIDLHGKGEQDVFVIYRDGRAHAYRNSCPHTGAPLNWLPDQFLDADNALIQCQNHDALFRIADGVCVSGPCPGETLIPVQVRLLDRNIVLDEV